MINIQKIKSMKSKQKIVMLTAYDFPTAKLIDDIVDIILVGDSLGMVVLGYENTTKVTMQDMLKATEAVARGSKNALVVGDMPIGTYDSEKDALANARLFLKAGAHAVKIENKPEIAEFLVKNGINVMGHIGLTPQTITNFKVQGKDEASAKKLMEEAKALDKAGCFSLVLECIPLSLAKTITETISIPTIGIGAGIYCDGQVLVTHDILGLFESFKPKFVKKYADLSPLMKKAFEQYAKDVREGKFPSDEYSFHWLNNLYKPTFSLYLYMSNQFKNKKIVIGVTGGIACYKVLDLIKELRNYGADIHVIMTEHATHFVNVKDFEKISGNEVQTNLFHPKINYVDYIKKNKEIKHISLADIANLFLICPATANIIGKIANGIADDLLTTSITATIAPVLICPAMNVKMWKNPIVQENVKKLKKLNYHFVEPEYGELACGYKGVGRLANLKRILDRMELLLKQRNDLKNKKIFVTAGATFEEIDPVRVITNKSSGKMGIALAEQAFLRGADVFLLRGHNSVEPNYNIKEEKFTTVNDLYNKIKKNINNVNIVIHSAAVSDFSINNKKNKKIKSDKELHLELTPTTKIFEKLKKLNKKIFLVGFKAEYNLTNNKLIESAYDILKKSNADLIVANDVGKKCRGFEVDTNEVFIVDKIKNIKHVGLADKRIVADRILDSITKKIK